MKQNTYINQIPIEQSLWETVYLHFGVYTMNNGREILFKAEKGPFASTAWIQGDEAYNDTLGSKFEAITGDDNCNYSLSRSKIRRLKDLQEFNNLLYSINTGEKFKNQVIAWLNY